MREEQGAQVRCVKGVTHRAPVCIPNLLLTQYLIQEARRAAVERVRVHAERVREVMSQWDLRGFPGYGVPGHEDRLDTGIPTALIEPK